MNSIVVERHVLHGFTAYFVVGTEEEALAQVAKIVEENPSEPAEVAE